MIFVTICYCIFFNGILVDNYTDLKKHKSNDIVGNTKTQASAINHFHTTAGSHTQISFDKEDPLRFKNLDISQLKQDLNRSREIDHRKKDLRSMMTGNFALAANRRILRHNTSNETRNLNQSK